MILYLPTKFHPSRTTPTKLLRQFCKMAAVDSEIYFQLRF